MITFLNENQEPNTATDDIICYKWLYLLDNIPISPNKLFCFQKGKTYMTFLYTTEYKHGDKTLNMIKYGFHAYKTKEYALADLSNRKKISYIQKLKLFKCVIPAGSNYYDGKTTENGEQTVLVSNKIVILEQMSDELLKLKVS